jgi:hypothetical protein
VSASPRLLQGTLAAVAVLLIALGAVLLTIDASARTASAQKLVDDLAEFYEREQGFDVGERSPILRSVIAESVANDGPLPVLSTESAADYVNASYGAFGGVFSIVPVDRPWSLRFLVVPIAVGGVLGVVVLLLRAARWTPRAERTASAA